MNWVDLFTSFNGRINRKPFWIAFCILWGLEALVLLLVVPDYLLGEGFAPFDPVLILGTLISVCFASASLPVVIKRLHDVDKSGWWSAIWIALIALLSVTEVVAGTSPTTTTADVVLAVYIFAAICGLWMLVEVGLRRGTQGPNRFGPDPLDGGISRRSVAEPA